MSPSTPIFTAHLFGPLDDNLIRLLRALSPTDWNRPTVARLWSVKDVAAHLLDINLRTASFLRDQHAIESPAIEGYADLVSFLNRLNAEWVLAAKRLSPSVLTDLLELTGKWHTGVMQSLPPFEKAKFAVAWAGETESANWFHIAREYTEKWHHQQQIRLAVGAEDVLLTRDFYFPFLNTCLRALPFHYRHVKADTGSLIRIFVKGEGGGNWFLQKEETGWVLTEPMEIEPTCQVQIAGEIAWRLFTKGITREEATAHVTITGDRALGEPIFHLLTVMA